MLHTSLWEHVLVFVFVCRAASLFSGPGGSERSQPNNVAVAKVSAARARLHLCSSDRHPGALQVGSVNDCRLPNSASKKRCCSLLGGLRFGSKQVNPSNTLGPSVRKQSLTWGLNPVLIRHVNRR